jgi:4-hydroxy-tetrahydrodipicolinate synthase
VIPRESVRLYKLCRARDWDFAMRLQRDLWRINEVFARSTSQPASRPASRFNVMRWGDPVPPQVALTADERRFVEAKRIEAFCSRIRKICG